MISERPRVPATPREVIHISVCSRDAARCEEARQRIGHLEQTVALACDVRDRATIDAAVAAVVARFGRIDLWINNAGYGLLDSTEHLDMQAARALFERVGRAAPVQVVGGLNIAQAKKLAKAGLRSFVISGNLGLPDTLARYDLPPAQIERHVAAFIAEVSSA